MSNGLNTLKKKYLSLNKDLRIIFWVVILNLALLALLLNIKSFNSSQYCFAKVDNKWFYGIKQDAVVFYNNAYLMKNIENNIQGNYNPSFEELIEYNHRTFFECYTGDWKNATKS